MMLTPMGVSHSIRAALTALGTAVALVLGAPVVRAGQVASAPTSTSTFIVFLSSKPIGNEQVAVERTAAGWTVSSSGRTGAPVDLVVRTLTLQYDAEWKPVDMYLDATIRGQAATLHTSVKGTTATTETRPLGAAPVVTSGPIDAGAIMLPSPFIAPFEAVALRLRTAAPGSVIPMYQPAQGAFTLEVGPSSTERIQTVERVIDARRTGASLVLPNTTPVGIEIWADEGGRLLRVSLPGQGLEFAREDIASVSARVVTMSRPNDEDFRAPANGFSLAGTVSKPVSASGKLPAVVLIGGSGTSDRDETAYGIPIFGQLANALADAGFLVARYDKRGVGQSGGRTEVATLRDFAEDAKSVVKAISDRKDVDRNRLAVIGHGEGGWIAMLTAAKNGRVKAVGLISTAGVTGQELNLYQVVHGLDRSSRPEAERLATVDLQKKIQNAVITGTGWDAIGLVPGVRRQADTPYFQSFLTLDPARVMKDMSQPVLIVQGERDPQVPPASAERLETLARARKKAPPVGVVKVPEINHLLVPATTGEMDEYSRLNDRQVSTAVTGALADWLRLTLTARR